MSTLIGEFTAFCEQSGHASDHPGSAMLFASAHRRATGEALPEDQFDLVMDFIKPDVPNAACLRVHRTVEDLERMAEESKADSFLVDGTAAVPEPFWRSTSGD